MTEFYQDTDTGNDGDNGTTWALAKITHEGLIGVMSAGDTGFVQGAAVDTAAAGRTFTPPGTVANSCKIIGVKDGTTNEPPVTSDLVVRGTDTLPIIQCTGAANDITFSNSGNTDFYGIEYDASDHMIMTNVTGFMNFNSCRLKFVDRIRGQGGYNEFINCDFAFNSTSAFLQPQNCQWEIRGGVFTFNGTVDALFDTTPLSSGTIVNMYSVDLSAWATGQTILNAATASIGKLRMSNCSMPASFTEISGTFTGPGIQLELIACASGSSKGATDSYQEYYKATPPGEVKIETTAVRTGGADDDATGAFSYALTPFANTTLEGSSLNVASPWIGPMWVEAGSSTATVYVANDGGVDYNEDEMWTEFYTVDVGDTAQHDQTFDPALASLLPSSTPITDDAVSSWGGSAANAQKMSTGALTYGFEGPIYARVHVAKRQATADTVFVDPLIEIT